MRATDCLVLILGGGKGTRLFPLTLERSKPAINFAGKYRLIDIPVSNGINSGFNKIFVLTQFLSASLHEHIMHTYRFDNFSKGFVEILSAEQNHKSSEWFHGTADAVRRVMRHLRYMPQEYVLILSGDHLYQMDYRDLLRFHLNKNADVTIASILVDAEEASRMGVIDCLDSGRVKRLIEKPQHLGRLKIKPEMKGGKKSYCSSMGIYLFKRDVLFDILSTTKAEDFGKHILPMLIKRDKAVYSYKFKGYWRDVGTIKSYYEASMDLISKKPKFNFFNEKRPVFTRARFLPPSEIIDSHCVNTLIADGCRIKKTKIENSIIGLRTKIMGGSKIKNSIIIGNNYYQRRIKGELMKPYIGKGVVIERAIVGKNVTIGNFCRITDKRGSADIDRDLFCVRDGITILKRGVSIKPRTVI
ncbi:MAG: glucose-1-phosphate adenylyltransferase [Candidatus Omnitrophota bacterium]|nr:MAG: glucose-1-phosphate adenylyltransferase [Candidatus Omnitrophota bacterium]